jgi:hypothetical protein
MQMAAAAESISVCVRIRPLSLYEKGQRECVVQSGERKVQVDEQVYSCDHVFASTDSQSFVFDK